MFKNYVQNVDRTPLSEMAITGVSSDIFAKITRNISLFQHPQDTPITNTNNILEAINTDLKSKLRVHNGMSKRYRKLFIDEYFKLKYK